MNLGTDHRCGQPSGLAHDAAFPFLSELFDEDRLLAELARAFPHDALGAPTEVIAVGYVPGRELSAVFAVRSADGPRVVTIDARGRDAGPGTATVALPGWNAFAQTFPDDPDIPALAALADPVACARILERVLHAPAEDVSFDVISYLPGRRCVLRLLGTGVDVFAKAAAGGDPVASDDRLRWLWEHPERRFAMPEPLGADPDLATRFERAAPGVPVDAVFAGVDLESLIDALAAALVNLHTLRPGSAGWQLRVNDAEAVMARIERKIARRVRASLPHLTDRIDTVVAALSTARAKLPPDLPPLTIHGDLHTANVLVDGATPVLIDLDELASGDPEFDLALFGTRLLVTAMERGERLPEAARAVERLPLAYREAGGRPIHDETYAWYVAATLIGRQAKTVMRHLVPGSDRLIARLIAASEAVLTRGASASVVLDAVRANGLSSR